MNESVNDFHIPHFYLISRYFVRSFAQLAPSLLQIFFKSWSAILKSVVQVILAGIEYVGGILWNYEYVLVF